MTTERSPRSPRWDLLGRYQVKVNGHMFIDRWRFLQNPLFAVLVSRIYAPDTDRHPHNHSRPFITIALSGYYYERVWPDPHNLAKSFTRKHRRFMPALVRQGWAHKISGVQGNLRTLVLAGRHHGTFFFWTQDGPVDWKNYK